jgi:hypothetical protein
MGIEPTTDIVCPPLDLKSRRPTRTYPLPIFRLKDFLFEVKRFEGFVIFSSIHDRGSLKFSRTFVGSDDPS